MTKSYSPRVYAHRTSPSLKPGYGHHIKWLVGETVSIVDGPDKGRQFVITSESMNHELVPAGYVREGYFADDPTQEKWAMRETALWFLNPTVITGEV